MENRGRAARGGIEIDVARRKREAVGFAHDGADDHSVIEIQIGGHLLDDAGLLRVFAAEIGEPRLHDFEKFQDHGSDAAKMAGTRAALEAFAQAFDGDRWCENPAGRFPRAAGAKR